MAGRETIVSDCRLLLGKCEELLPTLETGSVQLILTDPPFYKTKMDYLGEKITWDKQWPTRDAYLSWLSQLAKEWQRILAPNGSLYVFASPQMAAWVEVTLSETFHVLQRLTWQKPPFATKAEMFRKEDLRMFFPASEAILFCEQYGMLHEALRTYLDEEIRASGWTIGRLRDAMGFPGNMPFHWFARGLADGKKSEWQLPTKTHYETMQALTGAFSRPYDELLAEFESLCRPFTVSKDVPYTDVWSTFSTVSSHVGKHECEKPVPMLRHMIEASSRPGGTILDCFMGSGSTLDAAKQCGRKAIGIDEDPKWVKQAISRVSQEWLF